MPDKSFNYIIVFTMNKCCKPSWLSITSGMDKLRVSSSSSSSSCELPLRRGGAALNMYELRRPVLGSSCKRLSPILL